MGPSPTSSNAGLGDLLTTAKNLVTAVNTAFQNYLNVQGKITKADITSATLVAQGPGRLARVSVITAGSGAGAIYDANGATVTTNQIYTIPMTVGVVEVNMPVSNGIVVAPGTGQKVAISYA